MFEILEGINREGNEPGICEVNFRAAIDLENKPQDGK